MTQDAPPPPASPLPPPREPTPFGLGAETPGQIVRLAAAFYAVVTIFAVGYAFFDRIQRGTGDDAFLGLALPSWGGALSGIGVGLVLVGVVHVGMRVLPAVAAAARLFAGVFGALSWKQALLLALFSSVGEELLFRGALWPHLGWIGTSFLFGLVHILPSKRLWGYPLFALLAGVLFAILREATGSVMAPILAHFTVNAVNLAWLGARHAHLTGAPEPATAAGPSDA